MTGPVLTRQGATRADHALPDVDAAALIALLDGKYADIR